MALEDEVRAALEEVPGAFLAWNAVHLDATFLELELELARRMQAVQSAVLTTVLAARSGPVSACPACGGGPLTVRTTSERTVVLTGDAPVRVRRPYLVCSACGQGHFPPGRTVGIAAE